MDTELLKTFLEVRNTRHFSRAAENLNITQAAVSARIKQIEESLGVPLFIRERNNIQLTAEGERLVPYAETMLLSWARARQDVALKLEQKDQLSIGTTAGLWGYAHQDKLPRIYADFPDIAIRAVADNPDDLQRMVTERTLDIGILFDAPGIPDVTTLAAGKLKLVLASTIPGVTAKTAVRENYIYVDWGTAFNMFHATKFNEASPSILHTTMASIAESFMDGCPSSAYLPEPLVRSSGVSNIHIVHGAPIFSREISIVYRTNSERLDLIKQVIPRLLT
jgi:DNA-binding transcriptional LysR family regulator